MSNHDWAEIPYATGSAFVSKKYLRLVEIDKKMKNGQLQKQAVSYATGLVGRTTKSLVGEVRYLKELGHSKATNYGYDLHCANFVSAILKQYGLIGEHVVSCAKLRSACKSYGYKRVDASHAKPGDIWLHNSHTELVHSVTDGMILLIGSNNNGTNVQKITIDGKSPKKGGEYYSLQTNAQPATA